jgi:glycosyltransferase involved in cell wall biosynthesis
MGGAGHVSKGKIAYFFCTFPRYPFTFVCNEITALKKHGFDVEILVLQKGDKRELHEDFQNLWEDIRVVKTGGLLRQLACYFYFRLLYPKRVSDLRKKFSIYSVDGGDFFKTPYLLPAFSVAKYIAGRRDIAYLHSHFTYRDSTMTYMVSQLLNMPRGLTSHADSFVEHPYKLLKEQVADSRVVFAGTHQAREHILKISGDAGQTDAEEKVIYKPTGINLKKFAFLEIIDNGRTLISVCRFEPKKGLIYLVKACHLLIQKGYDIRCVMVGSASTVPAQQAVHREVLNYVQDHGIERFFNLTGSLTQEAYIKYLSQSAIFLAPYIVTDKGERDGVPTSLIEAMAVGLVPVVTDAGAITELVNHQENGLVVAQRDEAALADAVARLINDKELFERLRRNARRRVELECDVEKTEDIVVEQLRKIVRY